MNINNAESLNVDSSQVLQTCSALCSSGLRGVCPNDTKLKMVARVEEKPVLVPDTARTAAMHNLAAEFGKQVLGKTPSSYLQGCRGKAAC